MEQNPAEQIHQLLVGKDFKQAFNCIVKNYSEKTYWQVRRMVLDHDDANDVVQEIFIRVWKNIPKFKLESSISTWLHRISYNQTITFLQKNKKLQAISINQHPEVLNQLFSSDYFDGKEIEKKLQQALLQLPQQQRLVFNYRYYEDLKFTEIANIMSLSLGGVKSNYHQARKKIEHFLVTD